MIKFNQGWPRKSLTNANLYPRLKGMRVALYAPSPMDYTRWSAVRAANQDFLQPYEPAWAEDCLTREYYRRRLERQAADWQAGRGAYFFIHDLATADIIGGVNLNNIQYGAARFASLGYWLAQDYQGRGFMHEAAALAIDYAFHDLGLRRLNAACLPDNLRSANLLTRLGFVEEGFAPAYLQINSVWQDHRLFGLVNSGQACPVSDES